MVVCVSDLQTFCLSPGVLTGAMLQAAMTPVEAPAAGPGQTVDVGSSREAAHSPLPGDRRGPPGPGGCQLGLGPVIQDPDARHAAAINQVRGTHLTLHTWAVSVQAEDVFKFLPDQGRGWRFSSFSFRAEFYTICS